MIKDKKISMIVAANIAIAYKREKPRADSEETMKHVIQNMKISKEAKIFGIAGANFVVKYIEGNPKATEKEIMQKLVDEAENILNSIENQELQM